jgi:hypothetical protein
MNEWRFFLSLVQSGVFDPLLITIPQYLFHHCFSPTSGEVSAEHTFLMIEEISRLPFFKDVLDMAQCNRFYRIMGR